VTSGTGHAGGVGSPGGPPPGAGTPRPDLADTEDSDETSDRALADASAVPADGVGGTEVSDDPVAVLRRERDEYLDMVRRVQADFENYKKRVVRQQTDHLERAGEGLVSKILPVLDAFDLARAHLGTGAAVTEEGKALLAASALLSDTLAREGLDRIDDRGAPFDPTMHEAVDHVPDNDPVATGESNDDAVTDVAGEADPAAGPVVDGVLRAGYRFKGRVIRPAMVRVRG
jgi:molecular chaperone GrpE